MSLDDCLVKTTHRQYLSWMDYFDRQSEEPDNILVYYLMQIAAEVRRVLSKHPNQIKLSDFKLKFGTDKKVVKSKISREQAAAMQRASWFARLGTTAKAVKNRLKGKHDEQPSPPGD